MNIPVRFRRILNVVGYFKMAFSRKIKALFSRLDDKNMFFLIKKIKSNIFLLNKY